MKNRHYEWNAKVGIAILLFSFILVPISPSISMAADEAAAGAITADASADTAGGVDTANASTGPGMGVGTADVGAAPAEGESSMATVAIATSLSVFFILLLIL